MDESDFNKVLDKKKVDKLLENLTESLSSEDIFEVKKQVNALNKSGKLLPQRIRF